MALADGILFISSKLGISKIKFISFSALSKYVSTALIPVKLYSDLLIVACLPSVKACASVCIALNAPGATSNLFTSSSLPSTTFSVPNKPNLIASAASDIVLLY